MDDKLIWTLARPGGVGFEDFQDYVLHELAQAAGELVSAATGVLVTLQEQHVFSGAIVNVGAGEQRVDAVLQITSSAPYVATDPVNTVLQANCGHVQGWRVHQTKIFDESVPVASDAQEALKQTLWINERIDGTTPEFYSRNWYIHAGHLDGQEAESEDSRRRHLQRREQGEQTDGRWYIQNRVLEPITPTAWVVHGVSDYITPQFIQAGPGERYDPKQGMGEESFDKWPPRLFQGYVHRVARSDPPMRPGPSVGAAFRAAPPANQGHVRNPRQRGAGRLQGRRRLAGWPWPAGSQQPVAGVMALVGRISEHG